MNENDTHLELIRSYLAGTATAEETQTLEALILRDPAIRREFLRYAHLDAALAGNLRPTMIEGALRSAHQTAQASVKPRSRWLQWRPLAAAAAGLVFGLFSATVVFGFVAQRHGSMQTLLKEGFEDAEMVLDHRVPERAGVWSGDVLGPHEARGEVKPAEGLRMVTLPPVEKRKLSYAFHFLDVAKLPLPSAGQARQIEVTAQFHGAVPGVRDRFQIRLAAFAEDAAEAREIWVENHVDERALLHVSRTVQTKPADHGWTTVRSVMDVPAGASVVLVSLAAAVADSEATKAAHYLDDVHVRLITREATQP